MNAIVRPYETTRLTPGFRPWRAEGRAVVALAVPLILTQLAQMALHTTDVVMMGWLGPDSLAAGVLAFNLNAVFLFFGIGVLAAVAPMIAQAIGARRFRMVRRSVRQGLWVAVAIATPAIPVIWHTGTILTVLGQDPAIAAAGEAYLRAVVWGFVPALGYVVLSNFLAAHSRPRAVTVVTVTAIGINALADYALMFGHFGMPRLGLVGAGVATALVDSFLFLSLLGFVLSDRRFRRYHILGRIWRPDWPRFVEIFRVGLPIAGWMLAEIGLFVTGGLLLGLIGTTELAAHAIALQCAAIVYMVPFGLAQAATVRVGLAAGAGDHAGIARAGWTPLALACVFALLPAMVFLLWSPGLVALFLDPGEPENTAAARLAAQLLVIAAGFQLFDAAQSVATGALRGLKDTRVPMLLAVLGYWGFGFTSAVLLAFVLDYGAIGVWIGLALGLAVAAALLNWRLRSRIRDLTAPPTALI